MYPARRCPAQRTWHLALTRYCFTSKLLSIVHESIMLCLPSPTCIAPTIAILLRDCYAIEYPRPTPILYAIRHTILVSNCNIV